MRAKVKKGCQETELEKKEWGAIHGTRHNMNPNLSSDVG
jgi:hypothetical protein